MPANLKKRLSQKFDSFICSGEKRARTSNMASRTSNLASSIEDTVARQLDFDRCSDKDGDDYGFLTTPRRKRRRTLCPAQLEQSIQAFRRNHLTVVPSTQVSNQHLRSTSPSLLSTTQLSTDSKMMRHTDLSLDCLAASTDSGYGSVSFNDRSLNLVAINTSTLTKTERIKHHSTQTKSLRRSTGYSSLPLSPLLSPDQVRQSKRACSPLQEVPCINPSTQNTSTVALEDTNSWAPATHLELLEDCSTTKPVSSRRHSMACTYHLHRFRTPSNLLLPSPYTRTPVAGGCITPVLKLQDNNPLAPHLYQVYHGQLYLSLYVNSGLLTVHIVEVRHLPPQCNSYVEVSLIHDTTTICRTDSVHASSCPLFDERFSFELLEDDMKSRLLICVRQADHNQLIGAMSFGIRKIYSKADDTSGWFYLLAKSLGVTSHLKANQSKDCGVAV